MKTSYKKYLLLLLLLPLNLLAQNKLEGIVIDKAVNQPLPGVNIVVKGSTNGTSTNFDGTFVISNLKKGDVLTISYLGYAEQNLTYSGQSKVQIELQEESNKLNEVVVVGYGSVKKKDATGSVDLITAKEFNKGSIVSVDQLLTGKAPGVRITNAGGAPDSEPNIRIRGGSSLSAQNNPLIVIDGVPLDLVNPAGVKNPLSLVNPNDIESFSILKDASATAIYGSRASNGVIIITTKRGTSGKPEFSFSTNVAIGSVAKKINMMDGKEFTQFVLNNLTTENINRLGVDDPNDPIDTYHDNPATPDVVEGRILYNTDWQEAIYRNSLTTDNNFSARANLFGKVPFRASIGHTKNEGLVLTNDFERVTTSIKATPLLFDKHLKIDLNAKGLSSKKNAIDDGGAFGGALNMDPTKPIYDANSIFGGYYQGIRGGNLDGQSNPLAILLQRTRPEKVQKILGNIEFDYKMHFLPELRAVVNLGLEASKSEIEEVFGQNAISTYQNKGGGVFNPGVNYIENQTITNRTLDAYLVYTKELKGFLKKFDIQAGHTYQKFITDGNKVEFLYDDKTGLRIQKNDPSNPNNRYYNPLVLESFFGRSNIDLNNKYLFTFSMRADASSLFRKDIRWGYFPAAAFAWKVSDESFLKDSKVINNLKLRLGWGKTGQQDITQLADGGYFPSRPLFIAGNPESQYLPGVISYTAKQNNSNLTWEKTTTYNAGVEFDLFKNNFLSGSFEVYKRETTDLIAKVPSAPGQSLSNEVVTNIGSTSGRGAETSLTIRPIVSDKMNLEFNGNLAFNVTEVDNLRDITEFQDKDSGLPVQTGVKLAYNAVGFQPYSALVLEQLYDSNGKPIEGAFVDRNGDNVIDLQEDGYYKAMRPNWTFGFGTSFNYERFDLSASFRGQIGGMAYNSRNLVGGNVARAIPTNSNALSNVLSDYELFEDNLGLKPFSDYFLEDASFIRCENITVGYNFPKTIKNGNLKIYVAANNAFLITKYSGQDPENFNGIDNNFYPRPRVYSLGLNLNF
jgi:TonB-dependent starch-binding outer membrane protein SusC